MLHPSQWKCTCSRKWMFLNPDPVVDQSQPSLVTCYFRFLTCQDSGSFKWSWTPHSVQRSWCKLCSCGYLCSFTLCFLACRKLRKLQNTTSFHKLKLSKPFILFQTQTKSQPLVPLPLSWEYVSRRADYVLYFFSSHLLILQKSCCWLIDSEQI